MAPARVRTRAERSSGDGSVTRARRVVGGVALALCAAALACGLAGARAGGAGGDGDGAWETTGALARAMVNAGGDAWIRGEGWVWRASLTVVAKVLACASAACAVAAVAPERARREGADVGRASASGARKLVEEVRSETPTSDSSPRTPEGRSPRGPRTLEDVAKAKEAAKERKRKLREAQELLAKKEEEERAEIARLVVEERARREAARAAAMEAELATRAARIQARAKAEAEEEARRAKPDEREMQQKKNEEVADKVGAEAKRSAEPKGSNSTTEAKKIPAPLAASKTAHANGPLTMPRKQPAPPRSNGLTLRKIPAPRKVQSVAVVEAPVVPPPLPRAQPPLPPGPPPAQPPLPRGPPPDFARSEPPLPPMAPVDEVRRNVVTFGVLAPPAGGADANPPPLSPRSSAPLAAPPGFESVDPAMARRTDLYDPWSVVDSTIQSFLASTTDVDDEPFTLAARHVGGSAAYEDIFAPQKSISERENTAPPLPPTPHPEILANVFRDMA